MLNTPSRAASLTLALFALTACGSADSEAGGQSPTPDAGVAGAAGNGGTGAGGAGGMAGGAGSAGAGGSGAGSGTSGAAGAGSAAGSAGSAGAGGGAQSFCDDYPSTDGFLKKGNSVRNYKFINKKGEVHHLCGLANGTNRYAYIVIASLTCSRCRKETATLAQFEENHRAEGLVVVEAIDDAQTVDQLQAWPGAEYDYGLIAVRPDPHQIMDDCSDSPECGIYAHPHHFLVDLSNMQIVEPICTPDFSELEDAEAWDKHCVDAYL